MVQLAGRPSRAADALIRRELQIGGTVQGVGFRPFLYRLAMELGLTGWVLNSERGVTVEVEGAFEAVAAFEAALTANPPPLATIASVQATDLAPVGYAQFEIIHSRSGDERTANVPADAALCDDCRRELLDAGDRRHRYPFTNCTNCGPRFTIVTDIPYDRPKTTMTGFPMCPACGREYHDPLDRRFHAQPNACPVCGPAVGLVDRSGRPVPGPGDAINRAAQLLRWGLIVAVKGIGGFHLACDATNSAAVADLRQRKRRPARPLAVMARDLAAVRRICRVGAAEAELLRSAAAPIVLLPLLPGDSPLAPEVAPGLDQVGVMLPYTPLHLLLMNEGLELLVMTSGNPSGLPLSIDEEEARVRLGQIADAFLIHNRPIHVPCDDSVMGVAGEAPYFLRRSRGYVPSPIRVKGESGAPAVVGMGGDMKNAFCLVQGEKAVFSQHLGDMETEEARAGWRRALEHLTRLTGMKPAVVGYDLHPGYHSSRLARDLPLAGVAVQHHHAHLAACMGEHGLDDPAIGLVLDGTGYGTDGAVWGFEVLVGDFAECRRVAHLAYSLLPGGEAAIRHPVQAAAGLVGAHLGDLGLLRLASLLDREGLQQLEAAKSLMRSHINCPQVGSAGRLFDAVAALLGICRRQTYEGQAAMELGAFAVPGPAYPVGITDHGDLTVAPFLRPLLGDAMRGCDARALAGRFLATVVEMAVLGARRAREQTGISTVCLSGGTFQSAWLVQAATERLQAERFRVFRHRAVPPGDGGIALGQALVARRRCQI